MMEKELKFWLYSLRVCRILALLRNILSEDEVLSVEELYLDLLAEVG